MKKHLLCAAVLSIMMLTGCGSKNSVIKQYEDYLRYSLGADGELEYSGKNERGEDTYSLSYRDQNGTQHIKSPDSLFFPDYAESKKNFPELTEETYGFETMLNIVNREMTKRFEEAIYEQVLKPCFPLSDMIGTGEERYVSMFSVQPRSVILYNKTHEAEIPLFKKWLDPENGVQLCKSDLKSLACNQEWEITVICQINEKADAEQYIKIMQEAFSKYKELTGNPQNYLFCLNQKDAEQKKDKVLYSEIGILGEKADSDLNPESTFSVLTAMQDRLRNKLGLASIPEIKERNDKYE